jgi:hypothetical protein
MFNVLEKFIFGVSFYNKDQSEYYKTLVKQHRFLYDYFLSKMLNLSILIKKNCLGICAFNTLKIFYFTNINFIF